MKSILQKYLNDHKKWKSVADFMISYDDLSDVGGRELDALNHIQRLLNNGLQADAQSISALIRGLAVPSHVVLAQTNTIARSSLHWMKMQDDEELCLDFFLVSNKQGKATVVSSRCYCWKVQYIYGFYHVPIKDPIWTGLDLCDNCFGVLFEIFYSNIPKQWAQQFKSLFLGPWDMDFSCL
eukprot:Gb_18933 [translate_table: standard]